MEVLIAAECLTMDGRGPTEKLETKERNILRKVLGLVKENGNYKRRQNPHARNGSRTSFVIRVEFCSMVSVRRHSLYHFNEKKTKGAWFSEAVRDQLRTPINSRS